MNLDNEQKKIISLFVIALALFLLAWKGCYVPKNRVVMDLRSQVDVGKAEEESIYDMIDHEVSSLEEAVDILKVKAAQLGQKRIRQKDMALALRGLSEAANKTRVRIVSTKPQASEVFTNDEGVSPTYEGLPCLRTQVAMTIEGDYGQIGEYIGLLENSTHGIYTVDGFSIKRKGQDSSKLEINLIVSIYCFG
jgi:hypothetical protein